MSVNLTFPMHVVIFSILNKVKNNIFTVIQLRKEMIESGIKLILDLAKRGFTKYTEHAILNLRDLYASDVDAQMKAISNLEMIALDYPKQYLPILVPVFCHYICKNSENARIDKSSEVELRTLRKDIKRLLECLRALKDEHVDQLIDLSGSSWVKLDIGKINLSGFILNNTDFTSANLSHAILCHAQLHHVNFSHANLFDSNFSGAEVYKSTFEHANFYLSDLTNIQCLETNFTNSDFSKANLAEGNFMSSIFDNSLFIKANLSDADFSYTSIKKGIMYSTLLNGSNLTEADLSNSILTGVNLLNTVFKNTDINGIDIRDALNIHGYQFRNVKNRDKADFYGQI